MRRFLFSLLLLACPAFPQTPNAATSPAATTSATTPDQPPPAVKPEDKCILEGVVLNATTGEPLKKAHIQLSPAQNGQSRSPYGAATDAAGHFHIDEIDPGQYMLSADRTGFVRKSYGARGPQRGGAVLTLAPAQKLTDISFKLLPQAVITGRIVDEDNDPVAHAQVQATRWRYMNGKKTLGPAGSATTNDKGEYRIFGLAPGSYIVKATLPSRQWGPSEIRKASAPEETYVSTYYPAATSPSAAIAVEAQAGAEVSGIDARLIRARAVRVSGKVTNLRRDGQGISLNLAPHSASEADFTSVRRVNSDGKGNFVFHGVMPGSYTLLAQDWSDDQTVRAASTHIEVGDSNIEGVTVTLGSGLEIEGTVRAESGDLKNANLRVVLRPENAAGFGFNSGADSEVQDDGAFKMRGVLPDKYRWSVRGLPDGYYVKSVRFGDSDATYAGADLNAGAPAPLVFNLSPNGAELDGSVKDKDDQPAAGATVVVIPEVRDRHFLYKQVSTDQYGHFAIKGLAPGKYKVFAWDQVDVGAYEDPDFLRPYENTGESISLDEKAKESKDLKLILNEDASSKTAK